MKRNTIIMAGILAVVVLSLVIMLVVTASDSSPSLGDSGEAVMLIPLEGTIMESSAASLLSSGAGITPDFVRDRIEDAESDSSIQAIIFKVESPGGTVAASQEIARMIKTADIPIVILAGDTMASGAYYFASQADKIVANSGSLVGSIGVISEIPDLSGLYQKLGINVQVIKSGKNKDMFSRQLTPEERQKFQRLSDELYSQFVTDVSKGRKLKRDKVLQVATGEVFAATNAKKLGLVDELGGYDKAVEVAGKLAGIEDPEVVEYEPPSFYEQVFSMQGTEFGTLIKTLRASVMGRDLMLLESIKSTYGVPQYRYDGGR